MARIWIYGRHEGEDQNQYAECIDLGDLHRDPENEFRIQLINGNGEQYFLYIPREAFSEFTRACQKVNAKGIFHELEQLEARSA